MDAVVIIEKQDKPILRGKTRRSACFYVLRKELLPLRGAGCLLYVPQKLRAECYGTVLSIFHRHSNITQVQ